MEFIQTKLFIVDYIILDIGNLEKLDNLRTFPDSESGKIMEIKCTWRAENSPNTAGCSRGGTMHTHKYQVTKMLPFS